MKKFLYTLMAFVIFASMATGLTACKRTVQNEDPNAKPEFTIPATGSPYAEGIKLPKLENTKVKILMGVNWDYIEKHNTEKEPYAQYHATKAWEATYGGSVEIETVADSAQTEYLMTGMASGTAPDLIPAGETLYPLWSANGLVANVEDVADYLDLDDPIYKKDIMEQFKWLGKYQYIVTREPAHYFVVYNKTKFNLAGEKTPMDYYKDGAWTWSQFVKTAKQMTTSDGSDYGFTGWGLFPYFAPYPMSRVQDDGTVKLTVDDPKYMAYMTEVYNFYQREQAGRLDYSLQDWSKTFPQGTDAMVMTTVDNMKQIVNAAEELESDKFGIAPLPVFNLGDETERISPATFWAYSISAGSKNPKGAATYIRLEAKVTENALKTMPEFGTLDDYLTEEEKTMIRTCNSEDTVLIDPTRAIGDCYNIVDGELVPKLYYAVDLTSVQALIDSVKPKLQAEIDDFNEQARENQEAVSGE